MMESARVYVLMTLSIDAKGEVKSKNIGVTFNIHEAEEHKAKGVEHDFETFQIEAKWQEDAATTDLIVALRTFRSIVEEQQAEALR